MRIIIESLIYFVPAILGFILGLVWTRKRTMSFVKRRYVNGAESDFYMFKFYDAKYRTKVIYFRKEEFDVAYKRKIE